MANTIQKTPLWGGPPPQEAREAYFEKLFSDADAMSIQGYLHDGTLVYWNRASELIYGYTAQEALGRNLLDLIIPDAMREGVRQAVDWMFENGQGIPAARMVLKHKHGHGVPVYSSHTVVQIPGHPPVLFCMDADMTALAQAEAELRIAAIAFETQQGMLITDAQGHILRVNHAFTELSGYTADDVIGQRPSLLQSGRQPKDFYAAMWQSLLATGAWSGELWNRHKNGTEYAARVSITAVKDATGQTTHYVGTQTDMTRHKAAEAQILQLAYYDSLTQLPNRRLLLDRLQQAVAKSLRHHSCGAFVFMDIDNFKLLNDSRGHDMGDQLLQAMAHRLSAHLREGDTAARLGGDEFVVIMEGLGDNLQEAAVRAENAARRIADALTQPYPLNGQEHHCTVSVGVALFPNQHSSSDELLRQADLAMFDAKAAGRNGLRFFDPDMQAAASSRAEVVAGLREGLRRQQFCLHYQPQIGRDGTLQGFEALVRWERPGQGMIGPGLFIPIAEESGLILPLGQWVLETACTQLAEWQRQPLMAHLTLAVNVSAVQFAKADFVHQVLTVLQHTGAPANRLKLELTESLLVHKIEEVTGKIMALQAQGVAISLDDFGTGYSSMSYLRRLPLDQLKIDQSFVHSLEDDPHSVAIAQTIIVLGHTMGLSVLAEGVETQAQRDVLERLGCDIYQGYWFGKPMALPQAEALALGLPGGTTVGG